MLQWKVTSFPRFVTQRSSGLPLITYYTDYLTSLMEFFRNRKLRLSALKSFVPLFTMWPKEVRRTLNVTAEGNIIPTFHNPKIYGVTYDNLLHFAAHATKVKTRNKVLKAVIGTAWGMDKKTIFIRLLDDHSSIMLLQFGPHS